MGTQLEKLKERIRGIPSDFTYDELRKLLIQLGFEEFQKGATSGSRVKFYRKADEAIIQLHKPHPGNIVGRKTLRDVVGLLRERGNLE